MQAMRGVPLGDWFQEDALCDDVLLVRDALEALIGAADEGKRRNTITSLQLDLQNCGTAMRFLTAYCAVQDGLEVVLTGSERMMERPIGQLVDALRGVGAEIEYLGKEGFPPLRVKPPSRPPIKGGSLVQIDLRGQKLDSTQFVSALMLVGFDVLTDEESPYIEMTRRLIEAPLLSPPRGGKIPSENDFSCLIERDWSAASYWYEYVALYGGEIFLPDLQLDSLQGDRRVAEIFEELGVQTEEKNGGVLISSKECTASSLQVDFGDCPDLYPAVYVTCQELGGRLEASGTERLRHKESDRIHAFEQLERDAHKGRLYTSYGDHRVAMALMVAGYQVDDMRCVSKSYPRFVEQLRNVTFVVPVRSQELGAKNQDLECRISEAQISGDSERGHVIYVDDEGKGKKWALRKGVEMAGTEFVWLTDADVERESYPVFVPPTLLGDLTILPLRMEDSILERRITNTSLQHLQRTEYLAIQSLTMWAAEKGRAVMCSGANMIVRRKKWLGSYADLHTEIPSGDDMFLLESFKRRGLTVKALFEPAYIATIQPVETWGAFFWQRMRWAGKAPKYRDRDILLCGGLTALMNVLVGLCLPFLLVNLPLDWLILQRSKRYNLTDEVHLGWAILLAVVYPWYMLICLIGGWIRINKW